MGGAGTKRVSSWRRCERHPFQPCSADHGYSFNPPLLDIYVRPSLLPKTPIAYPSGVGDDPLPSEQHPSYPFGRPITPRPHGSHPRASLPNPILTSRAFQNEAAAWNGVGAFAGSSGAAGEGTAGEIEMGGPSEAAGGGSSEALAKPLNSLPAYLARLRSTAIATSAASLGHASNLRAWPFPRFGPGPSLVKARAEDEDEDAAGGAAEAAREMWLELDLETLLPVGRERDPLDYLSSRTSKLVGNSSAEEIQREQMLDAIEADLEARLAAEATAAAHRGEPAEGNNVEAEATSDLRRLFASQGEQSVVSRPTALARSVDEAIDRQAQATGAATATTTTTTSATSGRDDPLPSFLLDEYGGDAEELRNLLASAASARSTSQARGWASEDASPDAFGDGPTTRWFARARQAAQDRETRPPSGLTSAMLGGGSGHRDATSLLARGR